MQEITRNTIPTSAVYTTKIIILSVFKNHLKIRKGKLGRLTLEYPQTEEA